MSARIRDYKYDKFWEMAKNIQRGTSACKGKTFSLKNETILITLFILIMYIIIIIT